MKNVVNTCLLIAGMVLFSFVGSANAAIFSLDLEQNPSGSIVVKKKDGFPNSTITALLPSNTVITLSYMFHKKDFLEGRNLTASGGYSYIEGGDVHWGATTSSTPSSLFPSGINSSESFVNLTPLKTALAFSSAVFNFEDNTASATIINRSGGTLGIASMLSASIGKNKKYTVSYNVTETPIPAALPMFAMGLCAVAGIRRRKKTTA